MTDTRRDFLKKMLTAGVFTVACPHILLGKIEPDIKKKNDELLGIFKVKISNYPVLEKEWGSVVIFVDGVHGFFPNIIVTRVPKADYNVDFTALLDQCPHEGYVMGNFNEETYTFTCTGQGSIFNVEGTNIWGPASGRVLPRFELTYEGGDDILIEIPALVGTNSVETGESMSFLSLSRPNPCSERTSFDFGIEAPTSVSIRVYRVDGTEFKKINFKYLEPGAHHVDLDVGEYPPGVYFYELTAGKSTLVKQFVVFR